MTKASMISLDDAQMVIRNAVPAFQTAGVECIDLNYGHNTLRMPHSEDWARPGGTASGPAMMTIADIGIYVGIMSMIGLEMTLVTTNLNISFLAKPDVGDLFAKTRVLKAGKRLSYGETLFYSSLDENARVVAHATATFAMPLKSTAS